MTLLSASISMSLMESVSRAVSFDIFGRSSARQRSSIPANSMPRPMRCRTLLRTRLRSPSTGSGAVDEKSQFHENFANAAFDIGQAEIVRRKMGKQRCKAGADAVVHIGRKVLTLRDGRFHDFNLGSLAIFSRLRINMAVATIAAVRTIQQSASA